MNDDLTIQFDSVISRDKDLVFSESDGEIILLSIEEGRYYSMNALGSCIWNLLDAPSSVSGICNRLLQEYEVDPKTCNKEVLNFLNFLLSENLIKVT